MLGESVVPKYNIVAMSSKDFFSQPHLLVSLFSRYLSVVSSALWFFPSIYTYTLNFAAVSLLVSACPMI